MDDLESHRMLVKMNELRQNFEKKDKEEQMKDDKLELTRMLESHLRTTFIGDLASIEEILGELWGHGQVRLTAEQEGFRDKWMALRKVILDKGNNRIKKMKEDIRPYEVEKVGYNYELQPDKVVNTNRLNWRDTFPGSDNDLSKIVRS